MLKKLVLAILAVLLVTAPASADAPNIELTIASAIAVASFPVTVGIPLTITHDALKDLHVFNVLVNDVSLTGGDVGDPFDTSNQCKNPNLTSVTSLCTTNGSNTADVVVPWTIYGPGSYVVTTHIRHRGTEDTDEETVAVTLIVAEYPAPPAIANQYIAAKKYKLTSGARGCIISAIAQNHAHNSRYGPKGGPYNDALVNSDVEDYRLGACYGQ
jgi:hypothetical protein